MSITLFFVLTVILLIVGIAVILIALSLFSRRLTKSRENDQSLVLLQNQINEMARMMNTKLGESNQIINERLKENRESLERNTLNIHKQITDFTTGIVKMEEGIRQVNTSVQEVSSFQQIFRTPKLRGRWGELALEHILTQYFPKEMFSLQHYFKSGEAVDAILKLPNGKILSIDAKFPYESFERMIEAINDKEKEVAKKAFATAVKIEIDDIASKYILPAEDTMDVAIMYIPAEAVYFEINNSLTDVVSYAQSKRIFLSSPNTFSLMLQVIQQWAHDMQIGRQTRDLIKRMNRIVEDSQKLGESFGKLGKHLSDARSSYEDSDKRLNLLKERTEKLIELEAEEVEKIELPKIEK